MDRPPGSPEENAPAEDASLAPESVVSAVQRRLARLRFDLHDGPQQDLHLLAQDLRLFREQLLPALADDPNVALIAGRLDDLEAQVAALGAGLRQLITTVESPLLAPGALPEALREVTGSFAARTGIQPRARLQGELSHLTDSQQIAVLALVREALSNVRKHSDATAVEIEIESSRDGLRIQITDDGSGFDPEQTLVRAARAGHLGVVGMRERVRMLGGSIRIESRPGGPTTITAQLPRWPQEPER